MEAVVRGLSLGMSDKSVLAARSSEVVSSTGFTYGFMAVLVLFLLPSNLLFALGIGYDLPSSFAAVKIHPATYLTAFGLVSTLLAVTSAQDPDRGCRVAGPHRLCPADRLVRDGFLRQRRYRGRVQLHRHVRCGRGWP